MDKLFEQLPSLRLPDDFVSAANKYGDMFSKLVSEISYIFPLTVFLMCMTTIITVKNWTFIYNLVMHLLEKIVDWVRG